MNENVSSNFIYEEDRSMLIDVVNLIFKINPKIIFKLY